MRNLRHSGIVLAAGLALMTGAVAGCKDYLDQKPQGTLNSLTLQNKAGVEATLLGAYRVLDYSANTGWGAAASNWGYDIAGDDSYKGTTTGDQQPAEDIEQYNWTTQNADSYFENKWQAMYEGVSRANATLRLLAEVQKASPTEISDADAKGIKGEALFLRAHYHFEGWEMWGQIPYYKETDTDYRKTRVDPLPLILADLDAAIAVLPTTSRNGDAGRANQWTAKAFKGRVQVYKGDYAGAKTTLQEVMQSGPFRLMPDYSQVWSTLSSNRNGAEAILDYKASVNDGEPNGSNGNYGDRLNFPHSGSPFACCGFHQPSQNLINFYQVDANGLPLALSDPTHWNDPDSIYAGSAKLLDPRVDWSAGRPGVPFKDWPSSPGGNGTVQISWVRDYAFGGPYTSKKNVFEFSNQANAMSTVGWTNSQIDNMPMHIFRYADALLLLAEADVQTSDLSGSCTIVNQIRQRASVVAQGPGTHGLTDMAVPINDARITWAHYKIGLYTCPFASKDFAMKAVVAERRLELAMEGHRYFDLRRWNTDAYAASLQLGAKNVLPTYMTREALRRSYKKVASLPPWLDKYNLFPLPTEEIALSTVNGQKTLVQNPGW